NFETMFLDAAQKLNQSEYLKLQIKQLEEEITQLNSLRKNIGERLNNMQKTLPSEEISVLERTIQAQSDKSRLLLELRTRIRGVESSDFMVRPTEVINRTQLWVKVLVTFFGTGFMLYVFYLIKESILAAQNSPERKKKLETIKQGFRL
ncbi:MAG: hypothetical protein RMK80_09330, partial [Pseudobdellovibrionaceae bacterium]|nr:hypothetical protein [Pseudobdellovibrionaceae bacterium]